MNRNNRKSDKFNKYTINYENFCFLLIIIIIILINNKNKSKR